MTPKSSLVTVYILRDYGGWVNESPDWSQNKYGKS